MLEHQCKPTKKFILNKKKNNASACVCSTTLSKDVRILSLKCKKGQRVCQQSYLRAYLP